MTEPLTPADCDCRGMPFMPLDVVRLRESDITALATGDEFKAAVLLWCASWNQLPAASLPDDDRILARLAGFPLADWSVLREMALRAWVKCSDGRLYHPVVAEKALEAWASRQPSRRGGVRGASAKWHSWDGPRPQSVGERNQATRSARLSAARAKATHTPEQWAGLLEVCGQKCVRCGASGKLVKDHVTPIYQGGSDGIDNLQPLCPTCNGSKGPETTDHRPPDWAQRLNVCENASINACDGLRTPENAWQQTGTLIGTEPPLRPPEGPTVHSPPPDPEKPKSTPADEAEQAFRLWNETAQRCGLPVAKLLDEARRKAMRRRLDEGGLDGWREALDGVERSAFIRGLQRDKDGRTMKADLAFVCQAKSFQRLREGFYGRDVQPVTRRDAPPPTAAILAQRIQHYRDTGEWRESWGPPPEVGADLIPFPSDRRVSG